MPTLLTPPVIGPTIEAATRRQFLTGLATAGLLAGCAGTDAPASSPPATRTITTALGPVEVPTDPRRVVTLDAQSLEFALTLGAPVVGSHTLGVEDPYSEALDGLTEGIAPVSVGGEINLEAIAAQRPDLILTQPWAVEELRDQLAAIAPLATFDYWTDDSFTATRWEEHLREVGDALGRSAAVDRALAELDTAIEEFRARYPGDPADVELSIVRLTDTEWLFQTPLSFPGEIVRRLGFARPPNQTGTDTDRVYLSYEELGQAAGDAIVLMTGSSDVDAIATATALPLWQNLAAVREDRVLEVDGGLWLLGGGPLAGRALVDSLATALSLPT